MAGLVDGVLADLRRFGVGSGELALVLTSSKRTGSPVAGAFDVGAVGAETPGRARPVLVVHLTLVAADLRFGLCCGPSVLYDRAVRTGDER